MAEQAELAEGAMIGLAGSYELLAGEIATALAAAMPGLAEPPEILGTFPDRVVYGLSSHGVGDPMMGDETQGDEVIYQRSYTRAADGTITFADPVQVNVTATVSPAESAMTAPLASDLVPLEEAVVAGDGTASIKIIQPGWSSNGRYYSADLLRRDIPLAFPAGTHMHLNHQTAAEESARPEGDVQTLAGVLTDDPHWSEGPAGPGMYARAQIFAPWREMLGELAPHIGTSIRAWGKASEGEAEGRRGAIVERIETGRSVDFVTRPGAGGRVLQLMESATAGSHPFGSATGAYPPSPRRTPSGNQSSPPDRQERHMQPDEVRRLIAEAVTPLQAEVGTLRQANAELTRDNERLREVSTMTQARSRADQVLAARSMTPRARARVIESALTSLPMTAEGNLDTAAFDTAVSAAADAEIAYLREAAGGPLVAGMGAAIGSGQVSDDDLAGIFRRLGLSESAAMTAAKGRDV